MVSNSDNHLRNHGFLRTPAGWQLSPAFDINPDPSHAAPAMPLVPGGGDLADLLDVAEAFDTTRSEAVAIVGRVRAAVTGWRHHAQAHGIAAREISLMADAFSRSGAQLTAG